MNALAELLKLAFDKAWALGLPLVFFCGLVIVAPRYGLPPPNPLVSEWSSTGLLLGFAFIATSTVTWTFQIVTRASRWLVARILTKALNKRDRVDAIANLQTLNLEERLCSVVS